MNEKNTYVKEPNIMNVVLSDEGRSRGGLVHILLEEGSRE